MSRDSTEELALPYKKPLFVASIIVVIVVMMLFGVDQLRLRYRLAELQKQLCAIAISESQLHRVDLLAESAKKERPEGLQLIQALNTIAPEGSTFEVFFETDSSGWWVSTWGDVTPSGRSQLPSGFQKWAELTTECTGVVEERRLRVFRNVRTPAGRIAVLVLNIFRDRGFD